MVTLRNATQWPKQGHITYLEKTSVVFGNRTYSRAIIDLVKPIW